MTLQRRVTVTAAGSVAASAASGLGAIVIARALGPDGAGLVGFCIAAATIAGTIVAAPLVVANLYFGARSPGRLGTLVGNNMVWCLLAGLPAAFAFVGLLMLIRPSELALSTVAVAAATVPVLALVTCSGTIFLAAHRTSAYAGITVLAPALFAAGLVVVGSLASLSSTSVMIGYLGAQATAASAGIGALVRYRPRPSWHQFLRVLPFGLKSAVGTCLQVGVYRLDFIILGALSGASAVGIYAVAVSVFDVIGKLARSASVVLAPTVATGDHTSIDRTRRLVHLVGILTLVGASVTTAVSFVAIAPIFGAAFSDAALVLLLLVPGAMGFAVGNVVSGHLIGIARPGTVSRSALVSFVVMVVADVALIPPLGVFGAAIASSLSYVASGAYLVAVLARISSRKTSELPSEEADGPYMVATDPLSASLSR